MRAITAGIILTTGCLFINLTGCQLGKPSLGSLAWWQNDTELASRYIEPPSHQFTPSESAVVSNDPDLPPLPTDIQKTADSFEQEIARSYKELVKDSKQHNADLITSLEKTAPAKVLNPQTVPNPPEDLPQAQSPLAPLADNQGEFAISKETPDTGGFVPNSPSEQLQKSATPLKPGNTGDSFVVGNQDSSFVPRNDSGFQPSPETPNYMRFAENLLPNLEPKNPGSASLQPLEAKPPGAMGDEAPNGFTDQSTFVPTPIPSPKSMDNGTSNNAYPSTPHKSFGNSADAAPNTIQPSQASQNEQLFDSFGGTPSLPIPSPQIAPSSEASTLNLPTQGSYAPGSISTPSPIVPSQLKLPMPKSSTLH